MTLARISRRRLLTTAAAAVGAAVVGGTVNGGPARAASVADLDLEGLRTALTGRLLRPGDASFAAAARPWNRALADRTPAAIAQVANREDVVACVHRVGGRGVPLAARSGGHSYAGYSTPADGVVVDVSALKSITVRSDNTAVVGAGARLIDVYAALAERGRALPAGTCPTVGIAGLTLGGGIGVFARSMGLTCDHLIGATVVTADAAVHTVDANRDADLFWALRGGGGGHAGIVTEFTFDTVPAPTVVVFTVEFPAERTARVAASWSQWAHQAPDRLTSTLMIGAATAATNSVTGAWTGPAAELATHLSALITAVGAQPTSHTTRQLGYLPAMQYFASCADRPVSACQPDTTPGGTIRRETFRAASRIMTRTLSEEQAGAVVQVLDGRTDMVLLFDSLDGQVSRVGTTETAFPHRSAVASVQVYSWNGGHEAAVTQVQSALAPLLGDGSYVNYVNPRQSDWATSNWGPNLTRLRQIVSSYDPDGVFTFPQSVLRA